MNTKEIAFIICTNNLKYYDECMRYLEELEIPEGYETDVICIQEAGSMASGYNAGMQASSAKYKVYLHQDTFILSRRFIYDILAVFQENEKIGMIGTIGSRELPEDAECWKTWDTGHVFGYTGRAHMRQEPFQNPEKAYLPVAAIDGLIMITQYDVPWREDILDGWDFYDVSQSLEMQRKGYLVVVPYQQTPWCHHDCGVSKLESYAFYQERILQEYPDFFSGAINIERIEAREEVLAEMKSLRTNLQEILEAGLYDELEAITDEFYEFFPWDTQVLEIISVMGIYSLEKKSASGVHSEWFQNPVWEEISAYFRELRFVMLRIAYGKQDERIQWLKEKIKSGKVSKAAIYYLSGFGEEGNQNTYEYLLKEEGENPLVSVIIPVYNGEKIIGDTLESVLGQTYKNMEVIVVDDASTDNSRNIILEYAEKDKRVLPVFLDKNKHICNAGNIGFQKVKGKYVALCGHDDMWREDKIEKQVAFLEEYTAYSVCFSWADIIDENREITSGDNLNLYLRFCSENYTRDQWIRRVFLKGNHFCAASACVRREFLDRTGPYKYGLLQLQDFELWLRLLEEGPVYILPEKLTYYRRFREEGENLSKPTSAVQIRDRHENQWIWKTYFQNLSGERFVQVFKKEMRNPQAGTKQEILCEKILLLLRTRNAYAIGSLMELLEQEEYRNLLEEKYQFGLKDFYELNAQIFPYNG